MQQVRLLVCCLAFATLSWPILSNAQLRIEITSGVNDPVPVAINEKGDPAATLVTTVVESDLGSSGRIKPVPMAGSARNSGADFVLDLDNKLDADGTVVATLALLNVATNQLAGTETLRGARGNLRLLGHQVADWVYQKVLGVPGAFASRIAYVSVDGRPPQQRFQLIVADSDGETPKPILESAQPIMSPSFSPDGLWLAYVSFEARVAAIYVQKLATGERRRVSARVGVNGAPSWSPDGRKLALTLSGSGGNLDIYVLDLASQSLTRITDDPGIDTEAVWSNNGQELFFTSDRSGAPQIYRLTVGNNERPKRVSFGSSYNARPRISPDGKLLAMVTLDNGGYRIALQNIEGGASRIVTRGRFDESPAFAANSATLIYAGHEQGRDVLATVSVDGQITQRLKADRGQVREPTFGPRLR
jgi:TolB protein